MELGDGMISSRCNLVKERGGLTRVVHRSLIANVALLHVVLVAVLGSLDTAFFLVSSLAYLGGLETRGEENLP